MVFTIDVRNAVEAHAIGTEQPTPDELLPEFRSNPTRRRALFTASVDGVVVGRAMITTRPLSPGSGADLAVDVLPGHRHTGVGSALLDRMEAVALAEGEQVLKATIAHTSATSGERIAAPTGFGELPAEDPGVRFLRRRSYALELLRTAPHVEAVITYNAEENRPMLDVNEAMGFRPIGYEAMLAEAARRGAGITAVLI